MNKNISTYEYFCFETWCEITSRSIGVQSNNTDILHKGDINH